MAEADSILIYAQTISCGMLYFYDMGSEASLSLPDLIEMLCRFLFDGRSASRGGWRI